MKIFFDTGAFCSIINKKDQRHTESCNILKSLIESEALFYTSNFVLSETYTLIRFRVNHLNAVKFMDEFEYSNIKVLRISQHIENIAKEIFKKYKDKTFSFVDCTSFALIETFNLDHVFTFDSHFLQYSFKAHVTLLP